MKYLLLVACTILMGATFAQDQAIMRKFNRPTVANVVLTFDETSVPETRVGQSFQFMPINNKVNVAGVDNNVMWFNDLSKDQFNAMEPGQTKKVLLDKIKNAISADAKFFPPTDEIGPQLANVLKSNNFGGEVFKDWAKKDKEGVYSVIKQRTQLNISNDDIERNTDTDKLEVFKDMIKTNYIFIYHFPEILKKVRVEASPTIEMYSYKSQISVYVFKIDVSDTLFNLEIAPKFDNVQALMEVDYPITYLGMAKIENEFYPPTLWDLAKYTNKRQQQTKGRRDLSTFNSDTLYGVNLYDISGGIKIGRVWEKLDSTEQNQVLYGHLTKTLMDEVVKVAEMNFDDFKVRAPITSTEPILAPVGLRQGVSPDQRFRVYENVNMSGKTESKSIGIVRSFGLVGDNMGNLFDEMGEPVVTRFKQEFGGKLRQDMYMVQETNHGIGLSVGLKYGYYVEGVLPKTYLNIRGQYNISRFFNNISAKPKTTGLYSYFGLGYGTKIIENSSATESTLFNILDLQIGLEKRYYLSPKFDVIPEAGISVLFPFLFTGRQEIEPFIYLNPGVRGVIWIKEGLALELGFNFPFFGIIPGEIENPAAPVHFNLSTRFDF
jgi:hypothetical protein